MSLAVSNRVFLSGAANAALAQVAIAPELLQAVLVPSFLFDRPSFTLWIGDRVCLRIEAQFGPLRAFAYESKRVPLRCCEV